MEERNGDSLMEIDAREEEEDPFLVFIEYARSVIAPRNDDGDGAEEEEEEKDPSRDPPETGGPAWSWIASRILRICTAYSSGVTAAILLSDLSQAWHEQHKAGAQTKRPKLIDQLKKNHRRRKLAHTVTIDSIYEKKFLSLNSVLEAVIVDTYALPGTNIYMLTLSDFWSSNTIDLYLHRRYYELVETPNGILRKGREVFLTGCYLRTAREGCGTQRLLPTEYLVILLDEDQDDDAILIAAQFCSDTFSSVSLDAFNNGTSYSLYARIESVGSVETQGKYGSIQRRQIMLADNDGVRLKFFLWGEQVLLANLLSVGSMLGLERPYISSPEESGIEATDEFCLEYGSATHLYLVPSIQQEEQVSVGLTQNKYQGSRLLSVIDPCQGLRVSQVTLPRDSEGSIDFSNYPFRTFIVDLRDKMTSISLYGAVKDIFCDPNDTGTIFSLKIEDTTGAIWARLHFTNSWSLGRLGLGHVVYISGLSCNKAKRDGLEVLWHEKYSRSSFVNLSCLPAFLNSSCLHKISSLADLSNQRSSLYICRVRLDQIDQCHLSTRFSHGVCGHFIKEFPGGILRCPFCEINCNSEIVKTFHLKITLADEKAKIFAWCTGQTAAAILQISPDEFYDLPEDDQLMYPSSLENESFLVALANSGHQNLGYGHCLADETDGIFWEITRALKSEL